MKKKGFTLIELLAVIIILAVIALIATPVVLNVVGNAKKEANKNSVYGLLDAAKYYYAESLLDTNKQNNTNGTTNILDEISISGDKPDSGVIYVNSKGEIAVAVVYDDVCYTKDFLQTKLEESDDITNCTLGVDETPVTPSEPSSPEQDEVSKKNIPEVGDYVKMTPTLTSFRTDKTYTSVVQTINPSELNVWRVIRVNDDGTIEMVSENISSTAVNLSGRKGYKDLVGYLNLLASKYENSTYTIGSRYMGYNGQTVYLTDTSNTVDSTSITPPWRYNVTTVESQGGGDTLYTTDTDLVSNAIGTLKATTTSGASYTYWLASRYYLYANTSSWGYHSRIVNAGGYITTSVLLDYSGGTSLVNIQTKHNLRPIVTLKSGINYTPALGTSEDPFVLE